MQDPIGMTNNSTFYLEIDKKVNSFYDIIKNKNILPKTLNDLCKIEPLFSKCINDICILIDKEESLHPEFKEILKSRCTIDMYGKLSENFNLDFLSIPEYMGPASIEQFTKASQNINF